MLISMTGFGRAQAQLPGSVRAVVEIRSVNHRFLEVETRVPEGLQDLEENIRALVGRSMARGQVRVWVSIQGTGEPTEAVFHLPVARRYLRQLDMLRRQMKLEGPVTLDLLLRLPNVVLVPERKELAGVAARQRIKQAAARALARAMTMRRREGARLQGVLRSRICFFEQLTGQIRRRVPEVQKGLQERLAQRIETALQEAGRQPGKDPERLVLTEAAVLVQATDVSEELERIGSHLEALRGILSGRPVKGPKRGERSSPGRALDFMAQELQREVNTLGTKLRDGTVGRWVVEFKGQIEKLREQAANIE